MHPLCLLQDPDFESHQMTVNFNTLRGLLLRRWMPGMTEEEWLELGEEHEDAQKTVMSYMQREMTLNKRPANMTLPFLSPANGGKAVVNGNGLEDSVNASPGGPPTKQATLREARHQTPLHPHLSRFPPCAVVTLSALWWRVLFIKSLTLLSPHALPSYPFPLSQHKPIWELFNQQQAAAGDGYSAQTGASEDTTATAAAPQPADPQRRSSEAPRVSEHRPIWDMFSQQQGNGPAAGAVLQRQSSTATSAAVPASTQSSAAGRASRQASATPTDVGHRPVWEMFAQQPKKPDGAEKPAAGAELPGSSAPSRDSSPEALAKTTVGSYKHRESLPTQSSSPVTSGPAAVEDAAGAGGTRKDLLSKAAEGRRSLDQDMSRRPRTSLTNKTSMAFTTVAPGCVFAVSRSASR